MIPKRHHGYQLFSKVNKDNWSLTFKVEKMFYWIWVVLHPLYVKNGDFTIGNYECAFLSSLLISVVQNWILSARRKKSFVQIGVWFWIDMSIHKLCDVLIKSFKYRVSCYKGIFYHILILVECYKILKFVVSEDIKSMSNKTNTFPF